MRCSICAACSGFSITSDSVSSSLSVPRATAERDSTVRRSWIRSWRSSCRDETLTLAKIGSRGRDAALPERELARGALQHEQAEIDDQAGLLGDGDEFRRRHAAELRMVPARQRLEARDRAVFQPHDRLVQDGDLLALERAAQFGFERQAVGLARAHRRLEHLDAVAADALGVIHRELGVLEDLLGAVRLAVGEREADRGGQEDLAVVEGDRRADASCGSSRRSAMMRSGRAPTAGSWRTGRRRGAPACPAA